MSYSIDDTQPRSPSPFKDDLALKPTIHPEDDDQPSRRSGCLLNGVIGGLLLLIALAIVALAGAAGWTSGQREANIHATATQNAAIGEQIGHISTDIENRNLVLLDTRLRWLATQTPGVSGLGDYMMTATALYQESLPTPTPQFSPTSQPTEALPATEDIVITPEGTGGYDLASILAQAQTAVASSQWEDAIELLDIIIGADPTYQTASVRSLMSQALNSYARELYNANKPAEANLIVSRAEEFGALAEGLSYERMAASLYLNARSAVGTGSARAMSDLQALLALGPGRYYDEAQQLLYNLYVTRGDAYMAQGDSCSAAFQYQNATGLFASGAANGKLSAARAACANATPTPDPNIALPPDQGVAPVGVVATPAS